jgi:hypothetical protein
VITNESLILDVLDAYPATIEVFRKYGMGQIEEPAIREMAEGASLQVAANFVGLTQDQADEMVRELNAVARRRPGSFADGSG